jgi:hypothetical protein
MRQVALARLSDNSIASFRAYISRVGLLLATSPNQIALVFVALDSGLARAIGPGGIPLGLMVGTAFLIGTSVPAELGETIEFAMLYAAGGLWTILVTLVFWRVRPFKRLEQEVAAVWERTTALIGAIRTVEGDTSSVVGRHRRERALANSHQALREAVERARGALGTVRAELSGPGTTTAQLMILVRAASRIAAASVTIAETRGSASAASQSG